MKKNIILIISSIIIGIFIGLQFDSCNDKKTLSNLTTTVNTTSTIDTTTSTNTKIDTVFVEGKTIYIKEKTKIIEPVTNDNIYTFVQRLNEKDSVGSLSGDLIIKTYGYSLEGWELNWNYIREDKIITENVTIHQKDSTVIETKEEFYKSNTVKLFIGTSVGFNKESVKDVNLNATLQFKNYRQVYYEVGQPLQENSKLIHRIGVKIPIILKNNKN